MKDTLKIQATDIGYEITRTLSETVTDEDLQERLRRLEAEREGLLEELDRIDRNIKIIKDALQKGTGEDTLQGRG